MLYHPFPGNRRSTLHCKTGENPLYLRNNYAYHFTPIIQH